MEAKEPQRPYKIEDLAMDPQKIPLVSELADGPHIEYSLSCHCGDIRYKISCPSLQEPATQPVTACNCRPCVKSGFLFIYPEASSVNWIVGYPNKIKHYQAGRKIFDYMQCQNCSSHLGIDFKGKHPSGKDCMGINVRMVHNIDIEKLDIRGVRGRDMFTELNKDF